MLAKGFPVLWTSLTPLRLTEPHALTDALRLCVFVVEAWATPGKIERERAECRDCEEASWQEQLCAERAWSFLCAWTRHVYFRKNRQLKSPTQTMSTKCQ